MSESDPFYGKLHKTYECWCAGCAETEYLQPTYRGSVRMLREFGWKQIKGRWYCETCASFVKQGKEPQS